MIGILIIAHTPLANALRDCALHVFPDCAVGLQAMDVLPGDSPEESLAKAHVAMEALGVCEVLILSDVFGATPCNVAQMLLNNPSTRLVVGVNLPMLLRSVCYRHESLQAVSKRALDGGTTGLMVLGSARDENQPEK